MTDSQVAPFPTFGSPVSSIGSLDGDLEPSSEGIELPPIIKDVEQRSKGDLVLPDRQLRRSVSHITVVRKSTQSRVPQCPKEQRNFSIPQDSLFVSDYEDSVRHGRQIVKPGQKGRPVFPGRRRVGEASLSDEELTIRKQGTSNTFDKILSNSVDAKQPIDQQLLQVPPAETREDFALYGRAHHPAAIQWPLQGEVAGESTHATSGLEDHRCYLQRSPRALEESHPVQIELTPKQPKKSFCQWLYTLTISSCLIFLLLCGPAALVLVLVGIVDQCSLFCHRKT